ncbi:4Fe-4S dicluster domain-containing protein [Methanococcoides sp. SA1]|nr:4Fe-4S dicluster domain-containing protein [Methanococcoides burtonii]NPE27504.1 4Fe-4S dicluster domain-containing protein [Methanococcoides sp. SA1]NPE30550.1 4Fe-4S dicluster domain-containing protein [Methanococcoides sp. SA1]
MSENSENMKPYPQLNNLECKGCERCIPACPKSVLFMSENINERGYRYVEYKGEGCTGCGNCYYTCPETLAIAVHIPIKEK